MSGRGDQGRRWTRGAAALALAVVSHAAPGLMSTAEAQIGGLPSPFMSSSVETWSGAEATRHSWSMYTGATWAPLGKVTDEGLRLRLVGGYGQYRYSAPIDRTPTSIYGTVAFADLLVGTQMAFGPLTLKAFAGAAFESHTLDPIDTDNAVLGPARGAKWVVEGWLNLTPTLWVQADLANSTAHDGYFRRVRLGWRLTNTVSIGVEGGSFGNASSRNENGRGGAFARYEWLGGELSVSGGLSGDIAAPRNPYGTVMYMTRF